jgi:hypothetical protein
LECGTLHFKAIRLQILNKINGSEHNSYGMALKTIWDSGKVASGKTVNVNYAANADLLLGSWDRRQNYWPRKSAEDAKSRISLCLLCFFVAKESVLIRIPSC